MATALPKQQLPFNGDELVDLYVSLPNGASFEGTKREYFDALMALQYETIAKLKPLIDVERECRVEVAKLLYPNGYTTNAETGRMDGTDKFELPSGWVLEFEKRVGCKIDEVQLAAIREEVAKLPMDEESGEIPTLGEVIRYRAELSDSNYGKLNPVVRILLNQALTFTPGTPGVKLVPPKAKAATRVSDQKARAKEGEGV